MVARVKHDHDFKVLSYSLQPKLSSNVVKACIVKPCIATEVVCVLCEEDGNRRRHKTHAKKKSTDQTTLNRVVLGLTRAAIEREKFFGRPSEDDRRPCGYHPKEKWFTGISGNYICSSCQGMTKEEYDREIGTSGT